MPTRSKLDRQGKKIREASKLIEKDKFYPISEALELAQKTSTTKFDGSIEVHYNLGVDPRHADQNVRDTLVLPAGTGKTIKVAVLSDDETAGEKSGADIYGNEHIFSELDKGRINFDVLVATPKIMPQLGKYARLLGPRGLMPNPKSGTVTVDVAKAVSESKAGKVEYKVDSNGIVHLLFGKVSFTKKQLEDNFMAVDANIKSNKPNSLKGNYIKSIYLSSTMGPSIKVDISSF